MNSLPPAPQYDPATTDRTNLDFPVEPLRSLRAPFGPSRAFDRLDYPRIDGRDKADDRRYAALRVGLAEKHLTGLYGRLIGAVRIKPAA